MLGDFLRNLFGHENNAPQNPVREQQNNQPDLRVMPARGNQQLNTFRRPGQGLSFSAMSPTDDTRMVNGRNLQGGYGQAQSLQPNSNNSLYSLQSGGVPRMGARMYEDAPSYSQDLYQGSSLSDLLRSLLR